ncbi:TRM11 family SAM-dependent methyltransferase [Paenibacillus thalictri]|uniref:TRM11 family SAM-dependent methyltransferase n=1 Tax=Paenibacillus thalictri TaxID=2527873 RepID=UPI001F0F0CA4|nr:RNA methyltransferase [Paenibacillus thalictri]
MEERADQDVHSHSSATKHIYTFVCHEDERELCELELRTLLGVQPQSSWAESARCVDPGRSPFVKQRLDVLYESGSIEDIAAWAAGGVELAGATFKVVAADADGRASYDELRAVERAVGARIRGVADMREPARRLGLLRAGGRWVLGDARESGAAWLAHSAKPHSYSTALGVRVARAVANIAVPDPAAGARAIDPCCGIGTVLIEALAMGIDIVGCDINPLAVRGARGNLLHFGMPDIVRLADMRTLAGHYDAAVLDLPYNLCSRLSEEMRLEMLSSLRRLAAKAVVISTEEIAPSLGAAGFTVADRCTARKGRFARYIYVCV